MIPRLLSLLLLAGVLAIVAVSLTYARSGDPTTSNATVVIHYSSFHPKLIEAPAGVPITITLRNDDPIDHEWIVGTPDVHQRHRTGTEHYHGTIPTEVTVPALSERVTTVQFDKPGDYQYICHLPGHEQYGMVGTLRVLAH